jgi:cytochrome c553
MNPDEKLLASDSSWRGRSWVALAALIALSFVLGFVVLGRAPGDTPLGIWGAICRGLGLAPDLAAARAAAPVAVVPSLVAWTPATLASIALGSDSRGEFIALNCSVCHGERGVNSAPGIPRLAGMDAPALYKQLADFRSGKRSSGVMHGIALALSEQAAADVAAYYARQSGGLPALTGVTVPHGGHGLHASDPATRLVFAGDPTRGIAACAACHGPDGYKLGAPALMSQDTGYLQTQVAEFAQGSRRNDINEQMRSIAMALTDAERLGIARLYGSRAASP